MRLLGVVKIKLAKINTDIGVIKNSIKVGVEAQGDKISSSEKKKLDKVVSTFMDAISKQIEAQANTYDKEMNRYEKSITMLQSALNMIHKDCVAHAECLVEIARCKRLLAVNKKHLRGQWRQDAIEVDEIGMNIDVLGEDEEAARNRNEALDAKGLDGEVKDLFVDYKQEAIKAFVGITSDPKNPLAQDQEPAEGGEEVKVQTSLTQLLEHLGADRLENLLATFSLEYSEARGNLNKEQGFYYLSLYQYAVNRQQLLSTFLSAADEKHPDLMRLRQAKQIEREFCSFSSPLLPEKYHSCKDTLMKESKPMQIIHSHFSKD